MEGLKMKYFVIKPRNKTPDDIYAAASRRAMRAYANHIEDHNPHFADDLRKWATEESQLAGMLE